MLCSSSRLIFCRNLTIPSATAPLLSPKQLSSVSSITLLRSSIKTQSFTRSMASPSSQKTVHDFTVKNSNSLALIEPKDEPFTDDMAKDEVPIAMILPEDETANRLAESVVSQETESRRDPALSNEESMTNELSTIPEGSPSKLDESSGLEVASSPSGEVKLSLSCSSAIRRPGFHMPNLDAILKLTEDK